MQSDSNVERMLVVWCPDWSVVASGLPLSDPIAVLHSNRVVACSPNARREGVRIGHRRREAQALCPELAVVEHDAGRDAAAFESIVVTVESLAPKVEILHPGTCAVPTLGPSRYFGGDEALVQHLTMLINETLRDRELLARCCVGIADGVFAATLAARAAMVVPAGESPAFLAPQPIDVLERPELVDLLRRLGVRVLGDFAAFPATDVLGRFGDEGLGAHRLAQGLDEQPFNARLIPLELAVSQELDPPVTRVDEAAFVARSLAESMQSRLAREGLACNRVTIEAQTEDGEVLSRTWRHAGQLTALAIAERVRWQLDGWLTRNGARNIDDDYPTTGFITLRLTPDGLFPDNGSQLGFWGGSIDADERTSRALSRVQGMLGEDSVLTAVVGGGRSPVDQIRLVSWGSVREPTHPGLPDGLRNVMANQSGVQPGVQSGVQSGAEAQKRLVRRRRRHPVAVPTWPGQLPTPAPATVYASMPLIELLDRNDNTLVVDARGLLSHPPAKFRLPGYQPALIVAWAGPWLIDERWWDAETHRRCARLQLVTDAGEAMLVVLEKQSWRLEARYD